MLKDFELLPQPELCKIKIKSNYHTHNYLCGHACGTVRDYVAAAVENGLEAIGISDHCIPPTGSCEPYMTPQSMITKYLPQFDAARREFCGRIEIFSGAEIEYFEGYDEYYGDLLKNLDYLVLGQHEYIYRGARMNSFWDGTDEANVCAYFDNVRKGIETGMFALVAHPDVIFYRRPVLSDGMVAAFDRTVAAAARYGVAIEFNANGIRNHRFNYPTDLLAELCEAHDAPVVVSADCHSPDVLCDKYTLSLYGHAVKRGLRVVDRLKNL